MRINNEELQMLLAITNMYLKEHKWDNLEELRNKMVKAFVDNVFND